MTTPRTHHPSCRESDKDLVWHCCQCGLNEDASNIETELAQRIAQIESMGATLSAMQNERERLQTELAEAKALLESWRADNERLRRELAEAKGYKYGEACLQITKLETELAEAQAEMAILVRRYNIPAAMVDAAMRDAK